MDIFLHFIVSSRIYDEFNILFCSTANLAMFLVIDKSQPDITSVDDLKNCADGDCPITFGAKRDGATFTFFKESNNEVYKSMYRYMVTYSNSVMTENNEEGINKVYSSEEKYGFLMESSSIEYVTQRKCNLTQIGDPLDDKNYGIGMRHRKLEKSFIIIFVLMQIKLKFF